MLTVSMARTQSAWTWASDTDHPLRWARVRYQSNSVVAQRIVIGRSAGRGIEDELQEREEVGRWLRDC